MLSTRQREILKALGTAYDLLTYELQDVRDTPKYSDHWSKVTSSIRTARLLMESIESHDYPHREIA